MTSARWVRDPEVLWREVTDGVMLLPATATEPCVLTESGAAVWDLLETPVAVEAAAAHLAAAYGTTPAVVHEAIDPLLDDLERRGAVRRVQ